MKHHHATLMLWLLGVLPVVIALAFVGATDLAGPGAILNWLGRLCGIAGLAFLLVAAILSCRVPGFDRPFGGLTKLWKTHHKLGAVSFLLLLAHPVLLALAAAEVSLGAAAQTLLPRRGEWGTVTGWLALLAMMVFLAPSFKFFGEPEYQRWRNVHRLAAFAVVVGLAHTFLLARTMPEPLNGLIWFVLAAGAVGAVAWRLVFSRRIGRLRYTVAGVARPANNVVELSLEPQGPTLRHEAGQFVYLAPYDGALNAGFGEEHPYTVSSAPGEAQLRIAIKDLGDASRAIQHVAVASEVQVEGPYGYFFKSPDPVGPELWIAGGIGITPFLGRARDFAGRAATLSGTIDIVLVYCVQDESRAIFSEELRGFKVSIPGFRLVMHYFYQEGPLTQAFLDERCPGLAQREAYICGPQPLVDAARAALLDVGTARERIHTEEFNLL
jgi:predicted ferric reductase